MRKRKALTALVAAALAAAPVYGDTLHLSNGIDLTGETQKNSDGTYTLTIEGQQTFYRADEVVSVEKNTFKGTEYRDQAQAIADETEKEATAATGLLQDQRAEVDELLRKLNASDGSIQRTTIAALVALGQKMDILKYLETTLPSLTPATYPRALEAFCTLAPKDRAQHTLEVAATHPAANVRAQALRLMGNVAVPTAVDFLGRGLVDPETDVRIAAASALGVMGAKRATPALVASLEKNSQVVQGVIHQSLDQIWHNANPPAQPDAAEWEKFWSANKSGVGSPVSLDGLQPLVDPNVHFVEG